MFLKKHFHSLEDKTFASDSLFEYSINGNSYKPFQIPSFFLPKITVSKFYMEQILPQALGLVPAIKAGKEDLFNIKSCTISPSERQGSLSAGFHLRHLCQGGKGLIRWRDQGILRSNGRSLGE